MSWKFTLAVALLNCTAFLSTLVIAQYKQQQQQIPQQQSHDQVMSIQQRNQMMSTEVACKNIMAANLNAGQQPDLAPIPRECRELEATRQAVAAPNKPPLAPQSSPQPQMSSTATAAEPATTVGYVVLTVYRKPQNYSDVASSNNVGGAGGKNGEGGRSASIGTNKGNENGPNFASTTATYADAARNGFLEMDLNQNFNKNLYQLIATRKPNENVVYSPISLQTILALTYTGASGQTANELRTALGLPEDKTLVYQQFGRLMKSRRSANMQLQMANKLYYNKGLTVRAEFNQKAMQHFDAESERVQFSDQEHSANSINQWVAAKTNNRILNLVQPDSLDAQTSAILVNAIYFKAKWAKEFSAEETQREEFAVNARQKVPIEMMYNEDTFNYGDLSYQLGASVLQIPYKDSDLSMLLVLPHEIEGLAAVESRMRDVDLRTLPQQMQQETVKVQIPKFRIEFELNMVEALQKLQILKLFTDRAELTGIFDNHSAGISKVQHKAFIDVNEAGSEAAAATFNKLIPLSLPTNLKVFRADHPFMFAIISPQAVYFVGHVVNFS